MSAVQVTCFFSSFPRRLESRDIAIDFLAGCRHRDENPWIPAFAGMTGLSVRAEVTP